MTNLKKSLGIYIGCIKYVFLKKIWFVFGWMVKKSNKTPAFIIGIRQCGKTETIKELTEYEIRHHIGA